MKGGQKVSPLLAFVTDIDSIGLETAQGLLLAEAFYWDMNDDTRAWTKRFVEKMNGKQYPTMNHAGNYGGMLHFLKAIEAAQTRDGTKIVALAVLESPKISDGEVERFASQKNVLEAVLRGIPMKRRFAKNYAIIRNLVFNPRTPLDLALGLMKNMLIGDLRNLSNNKEVSDTVRKLATKMFKQKLDTTSKR